MLYALLDNNKVEPKPQQKAKCPCCGHDVISKCGELKMWHWAHTVDDNCDDWYEPETMWHRNWKKKFGKENSEVILEKDNLKHIADIFTKDYIVIELQNSPISTTTIRARETFYGERMIWIINGDPFYDRFLVSSSDPTYETSLPSNLFFSEDLLPNPGWFLDFEDVVPDDRLLEILNVYWGFSYKPEINKYFKFGTDRVKFSKPFIRLIKRFNDSNLIDLKDENIKYFTWSNPWKSWTAAERPAFIDYDRNNLLFVKEGLGTRYGSGVIVPKTRFLKKYGATK
ncbi:MAG: hypothetical protein RJA07_1974 [Bacteroidota bacterium]|jgi:competence CoiA-like predicted nuclease